MEILLQLKPINKSIAPDVGTRINIETHQDNLSLLHHHSNLDSDSPAMSPGTVEASPGSLGTRAELLKAKIRAQRRASMPSLNVSPLVVAAYAGLAADTFAATGTGSASSDSNDHNGEFAPQKSDTRRPTLASVPKSTPADPAPVGKERSQPPGPVVKHVFFIRHGESEWNLARFVYACTHGCPPPPPLTPCFTAAYHHHHSHISYFTPLPSLPPRSLHCQQDQRHQENDRTRPRPDHRRLAAGAIKALMFTRI